MAEFRLSARNAEKIPSGFQFVERVGNRLALRYCRFNRGYGIKMPLTQVEAGDVKRSPRRFMECGTHVSKVKWQNHRGNLGTDRIQLLGNQLPGVMPGLRYQGDSIFAVALKQHLICLDQPFEAVDSAQARLICALVFPEGFLIHRVDRCKQGLGCSLLLKKRSFRVGDCLL